jgi:hypothetical protein
MVNTSGQMAVFTKETSKMVLERVMEYGKNHQEIAINTRVITSETRSKAMVYFHGHQVTSTKDITMKI